MAFYGCDFIFDGKRASTILAPSTPGDPYKKLMVYSIGSYGQDDVDFSVGEIEEDRIASRYDSLLYGLVQNEPLTFSLVFGIDPDDLSGETYLTRGEVAKITQWLTGHQSYKILTIDQTDMTGYRYHAMVTGLKLIADGGLPVAFSAEITCDSPFAYKAPVTQTVQLSAGVLTLTNQSTTNGYYYPDISVTVSGATYLQIVNTSDGSRTLRIDDVPTTSNLAITIDNQNQIIKTNTGYNLYPGFNMKFIRLVPGENQLTFASDGTGTMSITCEYPVNIGA